MERHFNLLQSNLIPTQSDLNVHKYLSLSNVLTKLASRIYIARQQYLVLIRLNADNNYPIVSQYILLLLCDL